MKKLFFIAVLLCITAGYSQKYQTPVKLRTITIKDSYKGSSVRAYRVMKYSNRRVYTGYIPMETAPDYKLLEAIPVYYEEPRVNPSSCYISDDGRPYVWATNVRGVTYKKYL